MRDRSDRYRVETVPIASKPKRIGSHLVDAGLITADQLNVVLRDQQVTGMRFGEILVARGWVREQTIEWVMEKVVVPERQKREQETVKQHRTLQQTIPPQAKPQAVPPAAAKSIAPPPPPVTPATQGIHVTHPGQGVANQPNGQSTARKPPIAKPLPPVNSADSDVNWVG